mgnify:CR=1 FL=1
MVVLVELLESEDDCGYITYVFKVLESYYTKYIMCTRFPNWEHRQLKKGEIGYLSYVEIRAGLDKWYDKGNNNFVPYKYNNIQFIKFVQKKEKSKNEFTV